MAFRISRVACILGRPVALGAGRWGSRQLHSASERSLWYAFLMLGILPSCHLRTPFQTVSLRRSRKFATLCNALATPNIRHIDVAPSFATIHTCSLLSNERSEADESRPSLWKECARGVEDKLTEVP